MLEEVLNHRRTDVQIGDVIADRYEILSVVGEGGMGLVYKARHLLMNRLVAIKIIRGELVSNSTLMRRFQQEAMAVSTLDHPNIVSVYDYAAEGDIPYLVMDYLDGIAFSDLILKSHKIAVDTAVEIFLQACEALAHAHRNGIIHRDFKSSNLMICSQDNKMVVKVVDFGMAKLLRPSEDNPRSMELTQSGEIFGSPLYMSPEQCRGQALDERSDIYSLGCVMYYALTGHPPLLGDNVLDTLQKQIHEQPLPMSDMWLGIPENLESVIQKSLRKDPAQRYQTVADLLLDLQAVAAGRDRVMKSAKMRKPTAEELIAAYKPKRQAVVSHNFEMNLIGIFLLAAVCYATMLFVSGQFTQRKIDRDSVVWLEHNRNGDTMREQGKLAQAVVQYKAAIVDAGAFAKNDPRIAKSLSSLGAIYLEQYQYGKAESQLNKSVAMYERCYGRDCPEAAQTLLLLSRCYTEEGKKKEALSAKLKAQSILDDELLLLSRQRSGDGRDRRR